ncbi:MAG: His-Xaa-Ser system protein HxsD [Colwellia sp.]
MTMKITLQKSNYSETVLRKSLYWLSSDAEWILEESLENWVIVITNNKNNIDIESKFHRLVNDQILREKISIKSKNSREHIISKVLQDIEESL